jgi:hypothetical protein
MQCLTYLLVVSKCYGAKRRVLDNLFIKLSRSQIAEYLWLFMPGGQGCKEHRTACYARSVVLAATLGSLDIPCALAAAYSIGNDRYTLSLPLAIARPLTCIAR